MSLSWVACEARTGRVILDLPDLVVPRVGAVLGSYASATASLPVVSAPENWVRATMPRGALLVLLDDDRPVWGAGITGRTRTAGDTIELTLATPEAFYLGTRYVGDLTRTSTGQCQIVADLVDAFVLDGTVPLSVQIVGADATLRDRTYEAAQHKTVLAALSELSGVIGGPEFTVEWVRDLDDGVVVYRPVLLVGDRIGSPVPDGLGPAATFELPGPVTEVSLVEDYREGKGATSATAYSSGTGEAVPAQTASIADPDRPTTEYHWSPSTSITQESTLLGHAQRAVAAMVGGARALSLTAVLDDAPRLGRDWWIGDDVGYRVEAPAFPDGLSGTARAIGWQMDLPQDGPTTITPVLAADEWGGA